MTFGQFVLIRLSRDPRAADFGQSERHAIESEDPLLSLRQRFPGFSALVRHKRVVDFGCGSGLQAIALVESEGASVCGLDFNTTTLDVARTNARKHQVPAKSLEFRASASSDLWGAFDVVISKDAMEHYPDPGMALDEMHRLLKPGGKLLVSFGPPWFAPYGSHMHFFCKVPWINVFFREKTVMAVRARFRHDGAMRYEDCESGLNRMTISKFEKLVRASGFRIERQRYECIKRLNILGRIPALREFFINHVSVLLTRLHRPAANSVGTHD